MFVDGVVFLALYASWVVLTTSVVSAYRLVRWVVVEPRPLKTPEQLTIEALQFRVAKLEREAHSEAAEDREAAIEPPNYIDGVGCGRDSAISTAASTTSWT